MTAHAPRGARGVLYPGLAPGRFRHDQQPPSADLAPWIEHHWFVSWDLRGCPPQVQSTLPHPHVHLVVEDGAVRLWGVQRARFNRTLAGRGWVHGVKFKVGALPAFLRSPAADLMDRQVDAHGLLGDDVDRLLDPPLADAPEAGKTRIEAVLRARVPPVVDARGARLAEIVDVIGRDAGITSVEQLCTMTGESARRLQRDFRHYVGASPKWVIARYRLHEALALLQRGEAKPDAELAQRLGYFDQAHFIRDFRQLVGMTPRAYVSALHRDPGEPAAAR